MEIVQLKNVIEFPNLSYMAVIDCPKHVRLSSENFDDHIEFKGLNINTNKELVKPFYYNSDEDTGMSNLKKLNIIKRLIKELK